MVGVAEGAATTPPPVDARRWAAVALHALLWVPFAAAFWRADAFFGFLNRDAFAVILFEFLGIHAMPALAGVRATKEAWLAWPGWGLFLAFYGLFALALSLAFARPGTAVFFLVSLGAVALPTKEHRGRPFKDPEWAVSLGLYMATMVLSLVLPLPHISNEGIRAAQPGTTGVWIDRPETLAAFGVLYFAGRIAYDLGGARVDAWLRAHRSPAEEHAGP